MDKQQQVSDNYRRLISFARDLKIPTQDRYDVVHTAIVQCLQSDNPESCSLSYMFRAVVNTRSKWHRKTSNYGRLLEKMRNLGGATA
jgi:hypothetical protein